MLGVHRMTVCTRVHATHASDTPAHRESLYISLLSLACTTVADTDPTTESNNNETSEKPFAQPETPLELLENRSPDNKDTAKKPSAENPGNGGTSGQDWWGSWFGNSNNSEGKKEHNKNGSSKHSLRPAAKKSGASSVEDISDHAMAAMAMVSLYVQIQRMKQYA